MPFHCQNTTIGHAPDRKRLEAAGVFHCSVAADPPIIIQATLHQIGKKPLWGQRRGGPTNSDLEVYARNFKAFPMLSSQVINDANVNSLHSSNKVGQALL